MTVIPRHAVPLNDWPAADQVMWQYVIAEGDIFEGQGPGANWAPATIDNTRKAYGYWLHWLGINCLLSAPVHHPVDRITPERIRAYIEDMQDNTAPLTRFVYILDLLRFAQVGAPDREWDWFKRIKNRLWARTIPSRDKASLIRNSRELFELGLDLMNEVSGVTCRYNPLQAEIYYRDGLLIAILASRPVRLKNLTAIQIGRHLIRIDHIYWLVFEAGEVKNRRHIEVPIPEILSSYIDDYLSHHRPRLLQGTLSNRLWTSRFGGNLSCNSVRRQVKLHTEEAFGKPITCSGIVRPRASPSMIPGMCGSRPISSATIHWRPVRNTMINRACWKRVVTINLRSLTCIALSGKRLDLLINPPI